MSRNIGVKIWDSSGETTFVVAFSLLELEQHIFVLLSTQSLYSQVKLMTYVYLKIPLVLLA